MDKEQQFDERSERNIATLLPPVQAAAQRFLGAVQKAGINARIISGTRTYAEQAKIYAQGRNGNGGNVVTNAPPGFSNHNFGVAFDIGIFNGSDYLEDSPLYDKAAKYAHTSGLLWGGDWRHADKPHYEFPTGLSLLMMRNRHDKGLPVLDAEPVALAAKVGPPVTVRLLVAGKELDDVGVQTDGDIVSPVRALAEALGATVQWDKATRTVTVTPAAVGV